jgi:hypothetical protein
MRKGEPWGRPAEGPPDLVLDGGDAALARLVDQEHPRRIAWHPSVDADFARAVGLDGAVDGERGVELPCDAMLVSRNDVPAVSTVPTSMVAVNMVVVGVAPDRQRRWTRTQRMHVAVDGRVVHDGPVVGAVIANGQHLRGLDLVPRGHPGDGRLEIQVYAVAPGQRAAMRRRLPQGDHVPHPGIRQSTGRSVIVTVVDARAGLEVDGATLDPVSTLEVTVLTDRLLLLV